MSADYYDRQAIVQIDGTLVFKSEEDERNEEAVARILATYFSQRYGPCEFRSFGKLSPVDWWVERYGRIVGLAELKCRKHASTTYPTVFLNVRKWLSLTLGELGLGVPAAFAVRFTDGVFYIRLRDVDARSHAWRGCSGQRDIRSKNDTEPVIEVPVKDMTYVDDGNAYHGEY